MSAAWGKCSQRYNFGFMRFLLLMILVAATPGALAQPGPRFASGGIGEEERAAMEAVRGEEEVAIRVDSADREILLAEWLNALVYEMATRRMLFSRFEVRMAGDRLSGCAWGEPADASRHQPAVEVKGATYTALRVARENDRWVAQTVVDI